MRINFLETLDSDFIKRLLGYKVLDQVEKIYKNINGDIELDNNKLIEIFYAYFGNSFLENKFVRIKFFESLPIDSLINLQEEFTSHKFQNNHDIALILSSLDWKNGSLFVNKIVELTGLDSKFTPSKKYSLASVESVNPLPIYYDLFNYQREIQIKLFRFLTSSNKKAMVQMPTGAGKTRTTLDSVIRHFSEYEKKSTILWVAHTQELCEQALDTFKAIWPHLSKSSFRLVRFFGSNKFSPSEFESAFIVTTFQKLTSQFNKKASSIKWIEDKCELIIVDEAHKSAAFTYLDILEYYAKDIKILGLTATPGRNQQNDKENKILSRFFDQNLITCDLGKDPINRLRELGILSRIDKKIVETNLNFTNQSKLSNTDLSNKTLEKIETSTERNALIIRLLQQEIEEKRPTLLFSCSVQHSKILSALLNLMGIKNEVIDSNLPKSLRRNKINAFKKGEYDILINYDILSTGFDSPRISTIVMTRPTNSVILYSQIIGRGLRGPKMGGNKECKLIDLKDNIDKFGNVSEVYNVFEDYWN